MSKDFDTWNEQKKSLDRATKHILFKEREVWWCRLGVNVGYEQNGKGDNFFRPILVLKKFNNDMLIGLPLSTVVKPSNSFYHTFQFNGKEQSIIIAQIRLFDAKRLSHRLGMLKGEDFGLIKIKTQRLIFGV